jgi:murein DD-endopeptidase MepM/ murein hydrolase activator NlpD
VRVRAARRAVGVGLLLPGLLVTQASASSEDGRAFGAPEKKVAASRTARSTPSSGACVHAVRRGDTLSRLATRYRVTRASIIAANHLSAPDALRVGQHLQIPGCRTEVARAAPAPEISITEGGATELVTRVGPRRVPTRLFLSVPAFSREIVGFQWPVDGPIASAFGRRHSGWHAGIDIQAEMGTPIRAVAPGTVIISGWERYYGRMVKIQHADGFTSLYAHNLENLVEVGDVVETGTVIGTVGRTGRASANHLHFEIRQDETAYNPLHLLQARTAPEPSPDTAAATVNDDEDRE